MVKLSCVCFLLELFSNLSRHSFTSVETNKAASPRSKLSGHDKIRLAGSSIFPTILAVGGGAQLHGTGTEPTSGSAT
jgi:hypothetical protein